MSHSSVPHPAFRVPQEDTHEGGSWDQVQYTPEGIPVLLPNPELYFATVGSDIDATLDGMGFESARQLASYLPQLLAPKAPLRRAIRRALQENLSERVGLAVELGCSVGADLRTLSEFADTVIGVDLSLPSLRAAHHHLNGRPIPLLERIEGRSFRTTDPIRLEALNEEGEVPRVHLAIGNAMDPPLQPQSADVVLAANLLDNVSHPLVLLGQIDAILKDGGLLILTSPFAWNEAITPPEQALGGGTHEGFVELGSADVLHAMFHGHLTVGPKLSYEVVSLEDVPWTLREHARAIHHYEVHVIVARKTATLN